ncbi:hypothetical protein [Pseudotabrizicola algicola]|uniref:Uncharacterized protein n=1 Tax=Pseudotabrizicola algicola TaxID=2709381 RepID=A0A6B3RQ48_9RHOB|nr:hypothetical protein [Pseudotabrizicola algicola]NEX45182.1 hypothetical protein [Pseudotabrizicola algicola]
MAVTVFAFPPVRFSAHTPWIERAPVNVSRSFFTGARMVSAAQRPRRETELVVAGLSGDRDGAGYMENLRILLKGGVGLVRLTSRPVNWWLDDVRLRARRQSELVDWTVPDDPSVEWLAGDPVPWLSGRVIYATAITDAAGFPALAITNAPALTVIARPGDLVTLFSPISAESGTTARVMTTARTDDAGAAEIRLMSALSGSGRVNIGTTETAVFEMVSMSDAAQPTKGNWSYNLSFSEVFEDEVPGGFVEVDPWR